MAEEQLGSQIAAYPARNRPVMRSLGWILGLAGAIEAAAAVLWGVWRVYQSYYLHGPAILMRSLLTPAVLAIIGGVIITVGIVLAWGKRSGSVELYENGLKIHEGKQRFQWLWEDIASLRVSVTKNVTLGIPIGIHRSCRMVTLQGQCFTVDDQISKAEKLIDIIRQKVLPIQYIRYTQAMINGQTLMFGNIQVNRSNGLMIQGKQLAWEQIRETKVDQGDLRLTILDNMQQKRIVRIPVDQIPNPEVLIRFINDCARG